MEVGTVVGAENGNPGGTEFCIAVDGIEISTAVSVEGGIAVGAEVGKE